MKNLAYRFTGLFVVISASLMMNCDPFQKDLILPDKQITLDPTAVDYYGVSHSVVLINLKSFVSSSFSTVTLKVSEDPKNGKLTPLGEFLLSYDPSPKFAEGSDEFIVDVGSADQVKKLNVTIHMMKDTTAFPCGLFAVEDLVCIKPGIPASTLFLNNDRLCGFRRENILTSIYLMPEHGTATMKGDTIFYTPGENYDGPDFLVYKVTNKGGTFVRAASFGIINFPARARVKFEATAQNITEGSESLVSIPFDRTVACTDSVWVSMTGTAKYGLDYLTIPIASDGTAKIPVVKGQESAVLKVVTIDNDLLEGSKSAIFRLKDFSEVLIADTETLLTVTIGDDEGPSFANFATNVGTLHENNAAGLAVQIPLSSPAKGDGMIAITWSSLKAVYGTYFTTVPATTNNTITFNVTKDQTSVELLVLPVDNSLYTGNSSLSFLITGVDGVVQKGNNLTYLLTLEDDEAPSFANFASNIGTLHENNPAGIAIQIPLTPVATGDGMIAITLSSTNAVYGTNFTTVPAATNNAIAFNVTEAQTSVELLVLPVDNSLYTDNSTISFLIATVGGVVQKGNNLNYLLTLDDDEEPQTANFVITEWITPPCEVFEEPCPPREPFAGGSISESQTSGIFASIVFSEPAAGAGTITVTWQAGLPYCGTTAGYGTTFTTSPASSTPGSIVLNVSQGDTGTGFTILPVDNDVYTDVSTLTFEIASVTGVIRKGTMLNYSLTISDDEIPSIANFNNNNGSIGEDDPGGVVVDISFSEPTRGTGSITVSLNHGNASAFTTDPPSIGNSITWNLGAGETGVSFRILPIDNSSCGATGIGFRSSSCGFIKMGNNRGYGLTIVDDEASVVTLVETEGTVSESNGSGTVVNLNFSKPVPSNLVMDVYVGNHDGNLFSTSPPVSEEFDGNETWYRIPLNIPAGAAAAQFTVTPMNNAVKSGNHVVYFSFFTSGCLQNAPNTFYTLTIVDDD